METKIVYWGVFLNDETKRYLKSEIEKITKSEILSPDPKGKTLDHITLVFNPSDEISEKFKPSIGKSVEILLGDAYKDAKGVALTVEIVGDLGKINPKQNTHITVELYQGTAPLYSNTLIKNPEAKIGSLKGLTIHGNLDTFPRSSKISSLKEKFSKLEKTMNSIL